MCRWVCSSWEALSAETIQNGYKKCDLRLDTDCLAAASLVEELQRLSLVGSSTDEDHDFDRRLTAEEDDNVSADIAVV
ncbi:hypothetical protein GN244_ATG13253 [Phytophthora infestans]|uniref:DDE-1 domain-containing protein n=1 Tax=Phytophthora infestans TaxID=4787 RepID=A0A833T095_PHYIN|nr:hypothetical protein GN244_ATG13253 [Phytophthora infestans]